MNFQPLDYAVSIEFDLFEACTFQADSGTCLKARHHFADRLYTFETTNADEV